VKFGLKEASLRPKTTNACGLRKFGVMYKVALCLAQCRSRNVRLPLDEFTSVPDE